MTNNFLCLFPIKRFICNACYKLCACSLGKSFVVCSKSSTGRDTKVILGPGSVYSQEGSSDAASGYQYCTSLYTRTHTRSTALFPGLPRWAGTRKVKPIWILLKQETVSGSGISWAICKSACCSRQITTPAPHHSGSSVKDSVCKLAYDIPKRNLSMS